jgi:hypothetical protein
MQTLINSDFSGLTNLAEATQNLQPSTSKPVLYYLSKPEEMFRASSLPPDSTLLPVYNAPPKTYSLLRNYGIKPALYIPFEKDIFECDFWGSINITSQLQLLKKITVFFPDVYIIGRADYIYDFYHYFELLYPNLQYIRWLSGAEKGAQYLAEFKRNN